LVVGDGALVLLLLVLQRRLKIADHLHVLLDLVAQCCCGGAVVPATGATGANGTAEDVDVDVLGARRVAVGGVLQPVEWGAELAAAQLGGVVPVAASKAAVRGWK